MISVVESECRTSNQKNGFEARLSVSSEPMAKDFGEERVSAGVFALGVSRRGTTTSTVLAGSKRLARSSDRRRAGVKAQLNTKHLHLPEGLTPELEAPSFLSGAELVIQNCAAPISVVG